MSTKNLLSNNELLRKSSFYLDDKLVRSKANEIVVNGETHRVRQKVIDVLAYLAANRGEAVSRDEMLNELWQPLPASDEVLTQVISQLRKLLNPEGEKDSIIETIPKVGYRLIANVKIELIHSSTLMGKPLSVNFSNENFALFQWTEKLARQNRWLWVAVVSLAILFAGSLVKIFLVPPYTEEIFVETIDGETIQRRERGYLDKEPP